jgi:hypothetical protein
VGVRGNVRDRLDGLSELDRIGEGLGGGGTEPPMSNSAPQMASVGRCARGCGEMGWALMSMLDVCM